MVDADTGTVLFSKDADTLIPPASLAKLMTSEVIFDAIKSGRHSLADTFMVSENAWRTGGAPSGRLDHVRRAEVGHSAGGSDPGHRRAVGQ